MDNAGGPSRADQLDLMLTYEQQAHARTKAERDAAQDELADYDHTLLMKLDPSAAGSTDLFTWGTCLIKQRDRARQEAVAARRAVEMRDTLAQQDAGKIDALTATIARLQQIIDVQRATYPQHTADAVDAATSRANAEIARLRQERDEARALVGEWQTAVMAYLPFGWCFDPTAPGLMVSNVARTAAHPPTPPTKTQEATR